MIVNTSELAANAMNTHGNTNGYTNGYADRNVIGNAIGKTKENAIGNALPGRAGPLLMIAALSLIAANGCSNNKSQVPVLDGTRSGESYLYVAPADYYFGTRAVGTTTAQPIQISNRGADTYKLTSMSIEGNLDDPEDPSYNKDEFGADIAGEIVLPPANVVTVNVSFKPITEQQKKANFVVSYSTVVRAVDGANELEQRYYEAFDQEKAGDYSAAEIAYSDYVQSDPVTINKRRASIKLPVIQESEIFGQDSDLSLYLRALDERNATRFDQSIDTLEQIADRYSDSYLADDALYLTGYIQLMDLQDPEQALRNMQTLRARYPDSSYYDTSLYSEALAQKAIGNDLLAREILTQLRDRHSGLSVLGIRFAKDNVLSRLWFDRASNALDELG